MENTRNHQHAGETYATHNDEGFEQTHLHHMFYETPHVVSFTDEDILDELGPAQTFQYENRMTF
jgi:hypothetical protein